MIRDTDFKTLILCSSSAGFVSGIFTNVLDVIKTQIMNEALHEHNHMEGSTKGKIGFRHLPEKFKIACRCYYCFLRDLLKKHGRGVYFKGIGYNATMGMIRSSILFPLYEFCRLA